MGPIWSFGENVLDLKKSSLFLYIFEKNKFNDSDVHNAFHVSCEIHGPWDKGSGIREGPKWTDSSSINILNLRKSSPIPYKFEKNKCMVRMSIKPSNLNSEMHCSGSGSGVQAHVQGL